MKSKRIKETVENAGFQVEGYPDQEIEVCRLKIKGMACTSCSEAVERALSDADGVKKAVVGLALEEAKVHFDPNVTNLNQIIKAVEDAGFEADLINPGNDVNKVHLKLDGVHTLEDANTIRTALELAVGVNHVDMDMEEKKITVSYDPDVTGPRSLIKLIREASTGLNSYDASLYVPPRQRDLDHRNEIHKYKNQFLWSCLFSVPVLVFSMVLPMLPPYGDWLNYRIHNLLTVGMLLRCILCAPVQFIIGRRFYVGAYHALRRKSANMDVLVAVGTNAAYIYSLYILLKSLTSLDFEGQDFFETSAMLISFILLGKYLEIVAKGKTSDALAKLSELAPDTACLVTMDGSGNIISETEISTQLIQRNDLFKIVPGAKVPVDGIVIDGQSYVNESMITGEAKPVTKRPGDKVIGGTSNENGCIIVKATHVGSETALSQIVQLVEAAQLARAPVQKLADQISRFFVPTVVAAAFITWVAWFVTGVAGLYPKHWIPKAMDKFELALQFGISVVVVACPCALGLATPTAVMVATGKGASLGVLIKGGAALQKAHKVKAVVFDKTGTLTVGKPVVVSTVLFSGVTMKELCDMAIAIEANSEHPLAKAVAEHAKVQRKKHESLADHVEDVKDFEVHPGAGVCGKVGEKIVLVGNKRLLQVHSVPINYEVEEYISGTEKLAQTCVLVAIDGKVAGAFAVTDPVKPEAGHVIRHLQSMGVTSIMVTGDNWGTDLKLYSYHYLINGFAVLVTPGQADKLSRRREVANVVLDFSVRTDTTHTPEFLGLPQGAWPQEGGYDSAGEGVVIGLIDTGIDPMHPSFSDSMEANAYPVPQHFSGICEVTRDFPSGSCNRKLVGARHFAASAITRGIFNYSKDYASPFDGDGHGTHTASIASGNHGIPVVVSGHLFGNASGMAPRSHVAIYKALYKGFGGFAADVVAAIDQAAQDGVDILSLSITPNRRPPGVATFFNPIDMALLTAVKVGIFVVQAAGNTGPAPRSISSFSPWIFTVGAASHDRVYNNYISLGNNVTLSGTGLASGTNDTMYTLISAAHALSNDTAAPTDMYVGECQNPSSLNPDLVAGNLLICSYSVRFVLGVSTIKQALQTAKNLSAAGVVFYLDPFVLGFQINPTPMDMPGIIIPSANDSKVLLQYYNTSLVRDGTTKKVVKFGAVASISGGLKPDFSYSAPKVMYYSARGPDPEDNSLDNADILKPNLVAPGNSIWGAWSSLGTDSTEFLGEEFAMVSGTSMAAPHVAGLAALIKKKFPTFSPAAIASALSTTASLRDKNGGPIMAQRAYSNPDVNTSPATPFDMGNGFVNATAALDPGLIFDSTYDDLVSFLCGINGSAPVVLNYTGQTCDGIPTMIGSDLNLPSITIGTLNQTRDVNRTVLNVGVNETFRVGWSAPYGVSMKVEPTHFVIAAGEKQVLTVSLNATMNSTAASYGRIGLFGDQGHTINIPLSVIFKYSYNVSSS